jgi:transcriptional regulator with XRE-family HTH domain
MAPVCDTSYPGTREGVILVSTTPRSEFADFLRNRREAIQPEEVGLPNGGRRRTPGLRREEVAQLAGVGTTWYTWLEQGRDVRASISVLDSIARALRLTPAERAHLVLLGRGETEVAAPTEQETVVPTVARLVESLGPSPAAILGRRWDILVWNRAYEAMLGEPLKMPDGRSNLVWSVFMDPRWKERLSGWKAGARRVVARFRSDAGRHVGDPDFDALISALREGSQQFDRWWGLHEVATTGVGRKTVKHPTAGPLNFEHAVFKLEETPEQRFTLYTPVGETERKMERLLEESG